MEEAKHVTGNRIDRAEVGTLVPVEVASCQREVVREVRTTVLASDDMLEMEAEQRLSVLMNLAILTAIAGAFSH